MFQRGGGEDGIFAAKGVRYGRDGSRFRVDGILWSSWGACPTHPPSNRLLGKGGTPLYPHQRGLASLDSHEGGMMSGVVYVRDPLALRVPQGVRALRALRCLRFLVVLQGKDSLGMIRQRRTFGGCGCPARASTSSGGEGLWTAMVDVPPTHPRFLFLIKGGTPLYPHQRGNASLDSQEVGRVSGGESLRVRRSVSGGDGAAIGRMGVQPGVGVALGVSVGVAVGSALSARRR